MEITNAFLVGFLAPLKLIIDKLTTLVYNLNILTLLVWRVEIE